MNLVTLAPQWLYALLLVSLAAAAAEDAWRLRISNVTSAMIALQALVTTILVGPDWAIWQNVALAGGILAVGTFLFSVGIFGGGDVKLLAALGMWTSLKSALLLFVTIAIAGGVIALAALVFWQFRKVPGASSKTRQIPYGLAIAGGAALVSQFLRT